jgi:glycolate oxidase FAD binding subunit
MHPAIQGFKEQILGAISAQKKLNIVGSNSKKWYGDTPLGDPLSTLNYQGILDYQPEELVITVCAGTPLREVEAALNAKNQYFPFEPPYFGEQATIGGMVASGLAGPGRGQYGGLRDYVLGTKIMDGKGDVLSFGGKVMKNVAGYDVSRLLPGSLGTLALLLEVSIKVLPKPARTETLKFQMSAKEAIFHMNSWASQPLPLSASAWYGQAETGVLWLRLSGANAGVSAAITKLQAQVPAEIVDGTESNLFWESLREQTHPFFSDASQPLWRFAVNPLSEPFLNNGPVLMEWNGGQRWARGNISFDEVHNLAQQYHGHATLFRNPGNFSRSVFTTLKENPLTAPLEVVQQRVKKTFDPYGIFQTGRMPN